MRWSIFVSALTDEERIALTGALWDARGHKLNPEEIVMLLQGNRVGAIRSVKNRLALSLKEARDMVLAFVVEGQ